MFSPFSVFCTIPKTSPLWVSKQTKKRYRNTRIKRCCCPSFDLFRDSLSRMIWSSRDIMPWKYPIFHGSACGSHVIFLGAGLLDKGWVCLSAHHLPQAVSRPGASLRFTANCRALTHRCQLHTQLVGPLSPPAVFFFFLSVHRYSQRQSWHSLSMPLSIYIWWKSNGQLTGCHFCLCTQSIKEFLMFEAICNKSCELFISLNDFTWLESFRDLVKKKCVVPLAQWQCDYFQPQNSGEDGPVCFVVQYSIRA